MNPLNPRTQIPVAEAMSPSNRVDDDGMPSPRPFNDNEANGLFGRVSTHTETVFKTGAASYRKLAAIIAVVLFICLLIPGLNIALIAKVTLIFTAIILFITFILGCNYFKREAPEVSGMTKAQIIFFECVKTLFAPFVSVYDLYKERQLRKIDNAEFRILGSQAAPSKQPRLYGLNGQPLPPQE
jgi:hypothetical protein